MQSYFIHTPSPYLWEWSHGWGIRYYGLAYFLGFLAVYFGLRLFYKWKWFPLDPNQISDLLTYLVLGVLLGGRLGYCLIYDLPHTLSDPIDIIAFWRGGISGMSSHGGMIGVVLAMLLYSKRHKVSFWTIADHATMLAPIGLFLGRIANFLNGELWGRPTHVPWAIIFSQTADSQPRHPSQLYEAFGEGLFLFLILFFLRSRGVSNGKISALFLALYGIVRIILENFREPDVQIGFLWGWLTMGQLLSCFLIFAGIIIWILRSKKD